MGHGPRKNLLESQVFSSARGRIRTRSFGVLSEISRREPGSALDPALVGVYVECAGEDFASYL